MSNLVTQVDTLEKCLLKQEQAHCPVTHRFGPGIYMREVMIPQGCLAVGHFQVSEHQNILLKGRVTVLTETGGTQELTAPLIYVGKPGRKCGYIHEDMVWLNIYPNESGETDIEKLEARWLQKSETFKLAQSDLKLLTRAADKEDYEKVLKEFSYTEERARAQAENEADLTPLPHGSYKFKTGPSHIEGKGIFATGDYEEGEIIGPARLSGKRTVLGRYTNHSANPNATMMLKEGNFFLYATKNITGAKGGHDGEEITCDYRVPLKLQLGERK